MGVGGCAGLVFYHSVTNLDESGRRERQLRKELLYEPICWSNAASAETEGLVTVMRRGWNVAGPKACHFIMGHSLHLPETPH